VLIFTAEAADAEVALDAWLLVFAAAVVCVLLELLPQPTTSPALINTGSRSLARPKFIDPLQGLAD
jgi:hypothetical protein